MRGIIPSPRSRTAFAAALALTASAPSPASEVRPSIEITGSDTSGICDNSSGKLNPLIPNIINRDLGSSTLGELYVHGAGIVASDLETEPFGSPAFEGSWGFDPSIYDVAPGTRVAARMTTFYEAAGAGGVSYIGEVVFDCDTGAVHSLVNRESIYFDGFESGSHAFWSDVIGPV